MNHAEAKLQRTCLQYVRLAYPDVVIHHSPNELGLNGENARNEVAKRKAMGMRPGWPDLELFYKGYALFIELKIGARSMTSKQIQCMEDLREQGFDTEIIRDIDTFVKTVDNWISYL